MSSETPALPALHDIVLPEPVSWMPQTVGWWILLGLVLAAIAWRTYLGVRRRRTNRYRRLALARLEVIERALADPDSHAEALTDLPVLVKQTALACRPRSEVATLTGDPWLQVLDASYGGSGFTEGPGRLLPALAYERPQVRGVEESKSRRVEEGGEQIDQLLQLIRHWIRTHDSSTPWTPSTSSTSLTPSTCSTPPKDPRVRV